MYRDREEVTLLEPRAYVAAVCRRLVWIVAAGLVGALSTALLSGLAAPTYRSTTSLYFGVERASTTADLAASSLLRSEILPTVVELARSPLVLQPVVDELGLEMGPAQLARSVDLTVVEDTAVLEIGVTAPSAGDAARVARAVGAGVRAAALELYVGADGGAVLEVTAIVPPREPRFQIAPDTRLDAVLGLLAGLGIGVLLAGFDQLLRPRVHHLGDLSEVDGAPVLGSLFVAAARDESISRLLWSLDRDTASGAGHRVAITGPSPGAAALTAELASAAARRRVTVPATVGGGRSSAAVPLAGPAVVHVADPEDLRGAGVDGVVAVVSAGGTTRAALRAHRAALAASPVSVLGIVLDGVLPPRPGWRARVRAVLRGRAAVDGLGTDGSTRLSSGGPSASTAVTAVVALLALGADHPLPMATDTGLLAAVALLPVWASAIPRFRGGRTLVFLSALGLLWGALLAAWSSVDHDFSSREAAEAGFVVLGAVGAVGLLLWARMVLPLWRIGLAYGVGMLATGLMDIPSSVNAYKFELSLPLTIIVLSLAAASRRPIVSVAALAVLGALAILNDARSAFGFCLIAAALVLWQARTASRTTHRRLGLVSLGAVAAGGYVAISELLVAGALGAEVQARTVTQISQSGSLLLGGRPEWSATWALMQRDPMGFGLGVVPTAADVRVAESGFAVTNIPTAEGYIRNYMFGGRFELHSVIADLWSNLGVVGVALGLAMAALLVRGFVELFSRRQASALITFLVLMALWNLAFGPLPANLPDVALALGLVLLPRTGDTGTARDGEQGPGRAVPPTPEPAGYATGRNSCRSAARRPSSPGRSASTDVADRRATSASATASATPSVDVGSGRTW